MKKFFAKKKHSVSDAFVDKTTGSSIPLQNKKTRSDAFFFKQLIKEGHKQFYRHSRSKFSYDYNQSAALSFPYSTEEIETQKTDQETLLAMSEKLIIEHSNRRVDLFFYTLIAYYNTSYVPTYTHTELQHGRGRTIEDQCVTEACHSSFTPSLIDPIIYQNSQTGKKLKCLLSDTHLMDSLNSTVELPSFVNDLDDILESKCRPQCITILGRVAMGEINPIEGLSLLLQMMHEVLTDLQETAESQCSCTQLLKSFMKHKAINPKLIDLVITGTLSDTFSQETKTATPEYIQLLLRLKPEEKLLCTNKKNAQKIYLQKITEMQEEILASKSSLTVI